ncbi:MAG: HD domain-containing protein [Ruminococcus sp.]|nr:HD domain-containing protein [Ruminococcus sp.]
MKLELANKIIKNERYRRLLDELRELEQDRIFCRHDLEHFMNVARIAMIMCSEQGAEAEPDIIYSAALLHDIGRVEEYKTGVPHDISGVKISSEILDDIGCESLKKECILKLIASHHCVSDDKTVIEEIFYRADKKSRLCFDCKAQKECKWSDEKRNNEIGV